jgi:ABC-type multidrug transport system ATPase subunit
MILKSVSSFIEKGTMTAIIGPSGSGKTTLMNFLSGRSYTSNLVKSGMLSVNGNQIENMGPLKHIIGYVTQEDILQEELTVRQTLESYCVLRNIKQKKEWSQHIIDKLQLQKCADTQVGGSLIRGVSGGEKKRVSIGVELVSSPSLLFMDEPTTGLDAYTAFEVMKLMSDIKNQEEMTVISILHQPSNQILDLFDKVIILCDGMIVFDGPPKEINNRIKTLGFQMPKFSNGIEYLLEAIDRDGIRIELENSREHQLRSEANLSPNEYIFGLNN